MAKKDGMYFYNDWLAPFEKLEKEEVGELVIAMMKYFIYGEQPPEFGGLCGMAADFIFPQIDRSMEYAQLGKRAKGVSKTRSVSRHEHIEVSLNNESIQDTEEVIAEPLENTELTPEKKEVKEEPKSKAPFPDSKIYRKKLLEDNFLKFWRAYPNKSGKQQAQNAFERLDPDSDLMKKIMDALSLQRTTQRWQKEGGRYIPYPAKWIEGKRWEDEIDAEECKSKSEPLNVLIESKRRQGSFDVDDFFEAAVKHTENM